MSANETDQPQSTSETIDTLESSAAPRPVTLGLEPAQATFIQRPLSFFGKLEIFSILGGAIDKAMSGPDGLDMTAIIEGPTGLGDNLTAQNFRDADTFIKAIAKLAQYTPDLLADLYMVILAVPRGEREYVKQVMSDPEELGGLSDEDGIAILETFVDQNWDVMVDFFNSRIVPLFKKVSSKVQGSPPSKPLKNTRRTTAKA